MSDKHPLLNRQLRKLGIDPEMPPSALQWKQLLERIDRAYVESDQERYLTERSQDISSRELQELYRRLQEAQHMAGLGNWSYSVATDTWHWSQESLRIFQIADSAPNPDYKVFWRQILRHDRAELRKSFIHALQQGVDSDLQLRLRCTTQGLRWIHVVVKSVLDQDGKVIRVHGTAVDVTGSKRIQVQVRQSVEYRITQMLGGSEPIEVLMPALLQTLGQEIGWACAAYWNLNRQGDTYQRISTWSISSPRIASFFSRTHDKLPTTSRVGVTARVVVSGVPLWITDLGLRTDFSDAASAEDCGLQTLLAFPILSGSMVRGFIEIFSRHRLTPDADMLHSALFIAKNIAQGLERRDAEDAVHEREAHFRAVVEQATDSFFVHDAEGRLLDVNQQACRSLGYSRNELLRLTVMEIDTRLTVAALHQIQENVANGTPTVIESMHRRKNGLCFPVEMRVGRIDIGGTQQMLSLARDITERNRLQKHIEHLAYHDTLTELPNRILFNRQLRHAIGQAEANGTRLGVMFVDLDRFKNVNDTLGRSAGDQLLREMARRISSSLRREDMVARIDRSEKIVARLGGDEFVVLIDGIQDSVQVAEVAQRLLAGMIKEYPLEGQLIHMTASIGVSMFPEDGRNDFTLMKHADMALYRAKQGGKNRFEFYSPADEQPVSACAGPRIGPAPDNRQ